MSGTLTEEIKKIIRNHHLIEEHLLDSIWLVDVETKKFDYISPSIEKLSGYTPAEYENMTLLDRVVPQNRARALALISESVDSYYRGWSVIEKFEIELVHKSGDTYRAEVRARIVKDGNGRLKIVGAIRKITSQIRTLSPLK